MQRTPVVQMMQASSRTNILFLTHRVPYPPDKGDRIRTFNVLRFLSQRARVHLASLADEPVSEEIKLALGRYCERVAIVNVGGWSRWFRAGFSLIRGGTASEGAFQVPELRAILRRWAAQTCFDVSLASASSIASYLRLEELRGVPAVVDFIDVDSRKWFDYAASCRGPRAWLYRTEGSRLRRLEQDISTWASAVTLVGEAEVDVFRQFCPDGPVHVVRNGVDLEYFHPDQLAGLVSNESEAPSCVFVGALDYYPNIDALLWFCQDIWPKIHRLRPQAKFYVVGRQPSPALRFLDTLPGVELVGQVPDVRPYMAKSSVTIVPLRIARGVQNKILESLAMGRPTIVSPPTLAGLNACPGVHLLRASSPEAWVQTILALFDDPALRQRLGEAGRCFVEKHHSWERCLQPLDRLLLMREETDVPRRGESIRLLCAHPSNSDFLTSARNPAKIASR